MKRPDRDTPADAGAAPRATRAASALVATLASGAEWSGTSLAAALGVTRAAIWKQIEQLRALGLPVQAVAGRGYRLDAPIELLDAQRIEAAIERAHRAAIGAIDVHWQIDSTSSELARIAAGSSDVAHACLAEIQTHGRGRRGRAWRTPLGGGIAMSQLRGFDVGMAALAGLSLVAGVAVMRALADAGVEGAALKWPNDIVAGGRKLGGILVELGGDALGPCHAIVGIGINVAIGANEGAAIDQPWTDLSALANGHAPSRNRLAGLLLSRLAEALDTFAAEGFAAFANEYARHDALGGREILVAGGRETWSGIASGVTPRGALRVVRDGVEIAIDSGEVSVRDAERMRAPGHATREAARR
jgi:BirA family transcriptional regulator, biotin operon repressor / biotin---[acetyl-CoA-carboxylase] ligase